MKITLVIIFILCIALFAGIWRAQAIAQGANEMQVTDIQRAIVQQKGWLNTSRALTAEDLKGRVILLDFWTFCCINCIHIMPDLAYLEHTFGDALTVIGVHSAKFANERDTENIRNAILRYDLMHPVVNDFDFSIWRSFGVNSWPTLVLINPLGRVEQVYSGEGNRDAIEADVKKLLAKYAGKINSEKLPIALEKNKMPETVLKFPGKLAWESGAFGAPTLLVSDAGHHRILAVETNGDIRYQIGSGVAGFKDGTLAEAQFNSPQGMVIGPGGSFDGKDPILYVADTGNHALRRVDIAGNRVETIAGTGKQGYERDTKNAPALKTPLASPWDLAFCPDNKEHIVIAMAGTHQLWSYDIPHQTVSVIAGNGRESIDDGAYPYNSLSQPSGLSAYGDKLYFVDSETSSLRVFAKKEITTLIGTGLFDFGYKEGKQGTARMQHPLGVYADDSGIYVADSYNHSIRRYDEKEKILHNFAGTGQRGKADGVLASASFNEPNDLVRVGDKFYVADTNNHAIRVIDVKSGKVGTLNINEPRIASASAPAFGDALPNIQATKGVLLKPHHSTPVKLVLAPHWHVNQDAPSYFALFEMQGDRAVLVKAYDKDTLRKQLFTLPLLENGKHYRLQGTLYYCEDKAGSQCLIKSLDVDIHANDTGRDSLEYEIK